jgi:arginyl-tRNA synthetase
MPARSRIKAAVAAMTGAMARRAQAVRGQAGADGSLLRDGEPVKMSKRSGNFVTLPMWWEAARKSCASPC